MTGKNSFDEALRLFEELDGLDDAYIEDGMLPDEVVKPSRRRWHGWGTLSRFAESGWGVAILCAVVSLSAVVALARFGRGKSSMEADGVTPPGQQSPNYGTQAEDRYDEEQEAVTRNPELGTEEDVTLPEEGAVRGHIVVDEQGLRYQSYGNGTCILSGYVGEEPLTVLHVPNYSPDGDVVVVIDSYAFRNAMSLREVILPAGLRELDHKTFPMEAPIYHVYGNILYLGSRANPYMAAIATADNRPGATSLHPDTRIIACHALTYDTGAYFAEVWSEAIPAYTDHAVFTIPSGVIHIGDYALLDVGRDMTYYGYLVGWDTLTSDGKSGLARTAAGEALTVHCMDGDTATRVRDVMKVSVDEYTYLEEDILYGGYFMTGGSRVNEAYYDWLQDPESFGVQPDQFQTDGVFGRQSRVMTWEELAGVTFGFRGTPRDEALAVFVEAYNRDPAALYAGKTVVMLYVEEPNLYRHTVTAVEVSENRIHVTLARMGGVVNELEGARFVLIPLDDPMGKLAGAAVSYELRGPT